MERVTNFWGVVVPEVRKVAAEYAAKANYNDIQHLIESEYHEVRLCALLILVQKFEKAKDPNFRKEIVEFYLKNTHHINNWDLVDLSCYKILGRYSYENQESKILKKLSDSENMWEKRMAMVATIYYIKKGDFDLTKSFALQNMHHPHDLMHKANGWMLREMGKKDEAELLYFLKKHYQDMPRTTLRYAIEKLEENLRRDFLKGRV